jgi:hypothetical protein
MTTNAKPDKPTWPRDTLPDWLRQPTAMTISVRVKIVQNKPGTDVNGNACIHATISSIDSMQLLLSK